MNKLILDNLIESPTSGSLDIIDNEVVLNNQGVVKAIKIRYKGVIGINNNLPDGYSIKLNKNTIKIRNINARRLLDGNILFNASGSFQMIECDVLCFNGNKFKATINDVDKDQLIGRSETNLEDDTLIIEPSFDIEKTKISKSYIDDDTVVGLYTRIPFEDGYTGYYNYHPKEKVYLSGKVPNSNSKPLYSSVVQKTNLSFTNKINKVLRKVSKMQPVERSTIVGDEPINMKRILQSKKRAETIVSQIKAKGSPETKRSPEERIEVERKKY